MPNIKFWKQSPNITSFECQNAILLYSLFFVIRFSFVIRAGADSFFHFCQNDVFGRFSGRLSSSQCQKSSLTFEQVPNIKFWKQSPNITSFECQNAILFFAIRFSLFVFHCSFFDIRTSFFVTCEIVITRGPLVLYRSPECWGYIKISGYWGKGLKILNLSDLDEGQWMTFTFGTHKTSCTH